VEFLEAGNLLFPPPGGVRPVSFTDAGIMKFFEHWWTRGPQIIRVALVAASIAGMVLGGAADHYWT
jgi:preprotein translocase subunit Sec61beta